LGSDRLSGHATDPAELRAQLDHPVIDADGHCIEFQPAVHEHLVEVSGREVADAVEAVMAAPAQLRGLPSDEKRARGIFRMSWWAFPSANTRDRATAMFPRLFHERLDELGIDFAVVYPTFGLAAPGFDDQEMRLASVRAFNRYYAEAFAGLGDRITPAALVPMHTPDEAIAEIDYCIDHLGLRAMVFAGHVKRPLGVDAEGASLTGHWLDTFGLDSAHDYDPVWEHCERRGVSPTFHSSAMGWRERSSPTNYVFNHLGNFAYASEATCRSLFLGGVTRRFPRLRFAFLEGGVAWAAGLYADLLGHWEKRGAHVIGELDPQRIDHDELRRLFDRYAPERFRRGVDRLVAATHLLSDPGEDPATLDELRHCQIERGEDLLDLFVAPFHFGCEADDPLNALAFDRGALPHGAQLKVLLGSDIGHWDVQEVRGVLPEAWELVEHGRITRDDFRAFVCDHPLSLWAGADPKFFDGTRVEEAAHRWCRENAA
jgi:predicted TIM-barrel fold metal-dependent hydrolase